MSEPDGVSNLPTWNRPDVAAHYSSLAYVTPCEQLLFDQFLGRGMQILDLGVGGGRTTPYLSSIAGRYIGGDYAPSMIAECQKKYPHLEFQVVDAADLSRFANASFDAVIMAFNTVDNIIPGESRLKALREIHRVLKPNGILIFSSHNMRSILVRPSWNPKRVERFAQRLLNSNSILFAPLLWSLTGIRVVIAWFKALALSITRIVRRTPRPAFCRGEGYLTDQAHGGTRIHFSTPENTKRELEELGFHLLRVLGDDYPRQSHLYVTEWYYYVFSV